jgi:NAD(P)-dependent dehydrogenase (short-subunit alcohol dehydrogenase family)
MKSTSEGVIVLTGAGGGLGRNLTSYLLAEGYRNLALVCRGRKDGLDALLKERDLDPEKHIFNAELSDEKEVSGLRASIEQNLGNVNGLVNLAGASTNGLSWKLSKEDFLKVIDDNLMTTFVCCKEFIPGMRERGDGRIINISSVVASTGVAGASHYSAAKAGIIGFTKSLSLELAAKRITANTISLGYFQHGLIDHVNEELQAAIKDKIPLKRFGSAAEIGGVLEFLLSSQGAYTTGQNIHINGGLY